MLVLLLACARTADTSGGDDSAPDSQDSGTPPLECTATVDDDIVLVVRVAWDAPAAGTSYVEFGETEAYGMRTPDLSGSGPGAVYRDLVGNPGDTDVYWRAVTETADGTRSCTGVTRTGTPPDDLYTAEVQTDEAGRDGAGYVVGTFSGNKADEMRQEVHAYRRDGTLVWYRVGADDHQGVDLHWDPAGQGLWTNQLPSTGAGEGLIALHDWSGNELESYDTPEAHHMFAVLPDGTITYQQTDTRLYHNPETGEEVDFTGDAIAEIVPGGSPDVIASTWDFLEAAPNAYTNEASRYDGLDWTHGNAVFYYEESDTYLLSLAHVADVVEIDRATGTPTRIFGTDGLSADPPFVYQHDPHWTEDGTLLMFMTTGGKSGAIEYEIDGDGRPLEIWREGFNFEAGYLGQAIRLDNGDTLVNYGGAGVLEEVTPEHEGVWRMRTLHGEAFGQFRVVHDLYTGL